MDGFSAAAAAAAAAALPISLTAGAVLHRLGTTDCDRQIMKCRENSAGHFLKMVYGTPSKGEGEVFCS